MQSRQHLCEDKKSSHSGQWITRDLKNLRVNMLQFGCDVLVFYFLLRLFFFFPFSMWFELLACRLLWVINTNEGVLFIFEILFWDVQAPCNRCLFIFIINNKSKDSLLFNLGLQCLNINANVWFLQPLKAFYVFYAAIN